MQGTTKVVVIERALECQISRSVNDTNRCQRSQVSALNGHLWTNKFDLLKSPCVNLNECTSLLRVECGSEVAMIYQGKLLVVQKRERNVACAFIS